LEFRFRFRLRYVAVERSQMGTDAANLFPPRRMLGFGASAHAKDAEHQSLRKRLSKERDGFVSKEQPKFFCFESCLFRHSNSISGSTTKSKL
jgi:hypothetical protein